MTAVFFATGPKSIKIHLYRLLKAIVEFSSSKFPGRVFAETNSFLYFNRLIQILLDMPTEDHETLELYRFTLRRVREEALRALRCQGNIGPQRALHLLRESIAKEMITGQATDEQAFTNPE
jgi:hypothetical protein